MHHLWAKLKNTPFQVTPSGLRLLDRPSPTDPTDPQSPHPTSCWSLKNWLQCFVQTRTHTTVF